ncbi:hypothetical protein [Streptomyces sp. NRRL S-1022]|uniref:hypothetical protein n=1 Tax=Streptomyces sp. NRRL S-1022 TaxID=1463880 RepID=UPI0007C4740D|nr:hypothetical protein [Streptomyces sp. NRRL S-1022]
MPNSPLTRSICASVAAVAIGGALVPASDAAAAPAMEAHESAAISRQATVQGVGLDVFTKVVDVSGKLYDIINEAIAVKQNRGGYVKSLMEGAFYDARQRYNVLVIKWDHPYTLNVNGVVYDARVHASGYPDFHVVVFDSGTVVNRGDASWINWAFQGWFDRNGNTVNFHRS